MRNVGPVGLMCVHGARLRASEDFGSLALGLQEKEMPGICLGRGKFFVVVTDFRFFVICESYRSLVLLLIYHCHCSV